jgi:hypothetical protein
MKLKHLLMLLSNTHPKHRVELWGKNDLPMSSCTAQMHLDTSPGLLNKKVICWAESSHYDNEFVVILDTKVKICK